MLLTIAGILSAVAVFNAIYPAVTRSSSAVSAASARVNDRLKSGIEIVHAVGELDSSGSFQDTNGNGKFDFFVWVKNVGDITIYCRWSAKMGRIRGLENPREGGWCELLDRG